MFVGLVITRMKTKSAINRYLFNLAIADIGVLIVVFPIAVLQEQIRSYFPLGRGQGSACTYTLLSIRFTVPLFGWLPP